MAEKCSGHDLNHAGLRARIPCFLGKPDVHTSGQLIKWATMDAVRMEVDQAAIIGLDAPEVAPGIELANAPVQRLHMRLHVLPPLSLVVFKLAPGGTKGVAQGHIRVLVGVGAGVRPSDRNLIAGNRDGDAKAEQASLMTVLRGRLDHNMTAHDLRTELLEPGGQLANSGFESC